MHDVLVSTVQGSPLELLHNQARVQRLRCRHERESSEEPPQLASRWEDQNPAVPSRYLLIESTRRDQSCWASFAALAQATCLSL